MTESIAVRRALLSVWRKDGLVPFGQALAARGIELVSTGGSARTLREAGLEVRDVSELTGFPEMMDGRVKTLHPKVHGGLLFRRDLPEHVGAAEEHGILPIDLLVVDLYPFEDARDRMAGRDDDAAKAEVVEMIDIGGPAMIRAAAKNHAHVAVVTDPGDYDEVLGALETGEGQLSTDLCRSLAGRAFRRTAAYDAAIGAWMAGEDPFTERMTIPLDRGFVTRYGENPHQAGAVYAHPDAPRGTIARAEQKSGKELSYNNLLDASQALDVVRWLPGTAASMIKHGNPCGAAALVSGTPIEAFEAALSGDPLSAYGGICALNVPLDVALAKRIADPKCFFEVILAPSIEDAAVQVFHDGPKWGKNVRLLEVGPLAEALEKPGAGRHVVRAISGGLLVQDADRPGEPDWKVVTERAPTAQEDADLRFAWEVGRHVASNAIVFAKDAMLVGTGAGQMSRVDSVDIAAKKAGDRAKGAVLASDAFFPFADGLEAAAKAGVTAVVQPGGSRRDEEVIAAANAAGLAMVFTGRRHFRH